MAHGDAREEKWRGKRRMEWVAKQSSVWHGTVHPVLLQSFSPDPHSKKASTRLNWHPRRYKWTRPFRWKTESCFCACAVTFHFHSTVHLQLIFTVKTTCTYVFHTNCVHVSILKTSVITNIKFTNSFNLKVTLLCFCVLVHQMTIAWCLCCVAMIQLLPPVITRAYYA